MQLRQKLGTYAGTAVEVVRVLRDEELELTEALEFDEGEGGCVGRDPVAWNPPPWRGQAGVTPRPLPIGAAKVRDAGVSTNARAREGDDVLGVDDPAGDLFNLPVASNDQEPSFS